MSEPVILVPLDGSEHALAALPVAKVLGEIERVSVHILHVSEHELTGEESTRTGGCGPRGLYNRGPSRNAGVANPAGRAGHEAATDRHAGTAAPSGERCWAARR